MKKMFRSLGLATGLLAGGLLASVLAAQTADAAPILSVGSATSVTSGLQMTPGFTYPQGTYETINTAGDLAFGLTATVTSVYAGGALAVHQGAWLTDGTYGNGHSWIPGSTSGSLTLNLGSEFNLSQIKFGRDRLGLHGDRLINNIVLEYAGANGIYQTVLNTNTSGISGYNGATTLQITGFAADAVQFVRMSFTSLSSEFAIDELEIFGTATNSVPAPAGLALLGLGLFGLGALRRRKTA